MKQVKNSFAGILISFLVFISSCSKEQTDDINNSSLTAIKLECLYLNLFAWQIDPEGKFLYLLINNLDKVPTVGSTLLEKIDLKTNKIVKSVEITDPPNGVTNLILTGDNRLLLVHGTGYPFKEKRYIGIYDNNLNLVRKDTSALYPVTDNQARIRLTKSGNGTIAACVNSIDTLGNPYLKLALMDENLKVLKMRLDTGAVYGMVLKGSDFFKSADGNYIYCARQYPPPFASDQDVLLEKRDVDFKLIWRTKYGTTADEVPLGTYEYNNKIYVYCSGTDIVHDYKTTLFILVFNQNGTLLFRKDIESGGVFTKTLEPIIQTDNGRLLFTSVVPSGPSFYCNRGKLYTADANLNIIQTREFGGLGQVAGSTILKIEPNRYLLIYADNGFEAANFKSSLVLQYVDANGNIIK